jgi:hypothetical protein
MKIKVVLASMLGLAALALAAGSITAAPTPAPRQGLEVQALPVVGGALPAGAITVEEVARDGDRGLLKIKNRTPFIVILNIGGVRVGWMRPYRTGLIRGLVPGYHKLYAHSRYGTMSWGPRSIWVPGSWNLLY